MGVPPSIIMQVKRISSLMNTRVRNRSGSLYHVKLAQKRVKMALSVLSVDVSTAKIRDISRGEFSAKDSRDWPQCTQRMRVRFLPRGLAVVRRKIYGVQNLFET